MIEVKDVIEKHGLKRYVVMRANLKNRFAIVIMQGLDEWKKYSPVSTPLFCCELGNYYAVEYTNRKDKS